MRTGKSPGALSVPNGDRKFFETLARDAAGDVGGDRPAPRKLAQPVLGGNLPSRSRAYHDVIRIVLDRLTGRAG